MARQVKLVLIDAHALIHRAYHALPPMSTRAGVPTNAVYGFTTTLFKVLTAVKPTHVAAAFDLKGPTFRHQEYAAYKAHRAAPEPELVSQFDLVRRVVTAFNIPIFAQPGFEADDVIGTLVTQLPDISKVIVTGDLDTLQLVDDHTSVFTLKRSLADTILYTPAVVQEKFGFPPTLVPDYKGLRGDPSDNIPGVAGIGEKTAKELVSTFGTIEAIYDHLDKLPTRAKTRLVGQQAAALQSRHLATIRRDVPLKFSLEEATIHDYDQNEVHSLFEELGFRSLLQRLPKSSRGTIQPTLFQATAGEAPTALPANYHLAQSADEQAQVRDRLRQAKIMAVDTETDRLGARTSPIVGLSVAIDTPAGVHAWYIPMKPSELPAWREVLEDPAIEKVGHNLKYDYEVLQQSAITLGPIVFDSMIGSYLLHPGARQHSLDAVAAEELGHHCIPITDLIGTGPTQRSMSEVPLEQIARYAAEDADVALRLYYTLLPKLQEQGLTRVLEELELPLIPVLADIELTGIKVDPAILAKLQRTVARRLTQLQTDIWQAAGHEFNINSTQQLRTILYDELKLPTTDIKRTKSGFSTAAAELGKLQGQHAIIVLLEEYRELAKLQSTYIETLPTMIDAQTGRIHAQFNQTVAATGRLSGTDPNLQNIPVRTEQGQAIRAAFVAPRGRRLVKADYSQLELRIAAHIAQDPKMIAAFRAGEDIHRATAAWVHGVTPAAVTDQQRRTAKTLNFGVLYGMGPQSFARTAGISVEEARSFIDRYRREYKGLTTLLEHTITQAESLGFVETLFGRRRPVPEINATSPAIRAQAERIAFNFPIQGTEADILKKAMIALHQLLQEKYPDAALILSVHDELVCEAPAKQAEELAHHMKQTMEQVFTLDVPLTVDIAIGANWRDVDPVT